MKYLWNRYTKFILTIIIFFCSAFFQLIPVKLFNINNITPKIQILLTLFSNMMNILLLVLMYYKDLKEDFKVFLENKKEMLEEGFKIWVIGLVLMAGSNVVINLFSPNKIAGNEEAISILDSINDKTNTPDDNVYSKMSMLDLLKIADYDYYAA